MKVKNVIIGLFLSFASTATFAKSLPASESICLEPAVNEVIRASQADLHLVRDRETALITRLINLDTNESYDLGFISVNKGVEFISFENETHLYNIWAQPTVNGDCEIIEANIEPIADEMSKMIP